MHFFFFSKDGFQNFRKKLICWQTTMKRQKWDMLAWLGMKGFQKKAYKGSYIFLSASLLLTLNFFLRSWSEFQNSSCNLTPYTPNSKATWCPSIWAGHLEMFEDHCLHLPPLLWPQCPQLIAEHFHLSRLDRLQLPTSTGRARTKPGHSPPAAAVSGKIRGLLCLHCRLCTSHDGFLPISEQPGIVDPKSTWCFPVIPKSFTELHLSSIFLCCHWALNYFFNPFRELHVFFHSRICDHGTLKPDLPKSWDILPKIRFLVKISLVHLQHSLGGSAWPNLQ